MALWPNLSFFPKRLPSAHCNQVIELAAYGPSQPPDEEASSAELLCPVRALICYIQETAGFRQSDGLCVCYGSPRKGQALSRQRLSKWVVEVIEQAYKSSGLPLPLNIRGYSTRSVPTSWAALRGMPLSEICAAASWVSACTFAQFYRVNVAAYHAVAAAVFQEPSGPS